MFARFDREEKVGATLIGADPRAIQPDFRQSTAGALSFPYVLRDID